MQVLGVLLKLRRLRGRGGGDGGISAPILKTVEDLDCLAHRAPSIVCNTGGWRRLLPFLFTFCTRMVGALGSFQRIKHALLPVFCVAGLSFRTRRNATEISFRPSPFPLLPPLQANAPPPPPKPSPPKPFCPPPTSSFLHIAGPQSCGECREAIHDKAPPAVTSHYPPDKRAARDELPTHPSFTHGRSFLLAASLQNSCPTMPC